MKNTKNKTGLFIITIMALGILPFLQIDYRYLLKMGISSSQLIVSIAGLFIWLSSIIALIYGILARKGWTFVWARIPLYFSIFALLKQLLIFGIYGEGIRIIGYVIIFLACLFFLKNKDIRSQFLITEKQIKSEKIINWINLICITSALLFYWLILLPKANKIPNMFYTPIKKTLEMSKRDFNQSEYSVQKAFGWEFLVPQEVDIKKDHSDKEEDFDKSIIFTNEDKSIYILVYKKSPILSNEWSNFGRLLHLGSDYELIKKMHYEKIGIAFLILKSLAIPKNADIYELNVGTLKGFMSRIIDSKNDNIVYDYILFDKNDAHINIVLLIKSSRLTEDQIEQIIIRITKVE